MVTSRPEKVVGMHFFNPATVMKLVEVISTQRTADEEGRRRPFASDVLGSGSCTARTERASS